MSLLKGTYRDDYFDVHDRYRCIKLFGDPSTAFAPSMVNLQSHDANGGRTNYWLWVTDAGLLNINNAEPTSDSSGAAVGGSGTYATVDLANVASTAIPEDLISDANNTDTLGSNTFSWASLYLGTSLIFKETSNNLTVVATDQGTGARQATIPDLVSTDDEFCMLANSQALTNKTYDGLTISASANTFTLTRGTSTLVLAEGNTDVDIAADVQVDLDFDLSTTTEDVTLDQSLATTDDVTFNAVVSTTAATLATASTIGNLTLGTGSIADSGSAISFGDNALTTTGTINIDADDVNLTLGEDQATDSEIWFDSIALRFRDSATSGAKPTGYTLNELATGTTLNPTVTGDLTISDGNFTWANTDDETATWTLSGAAAGTEAMNIIIANVSTGTGIELTMDGLANGTALLVDADGGCGSTGFYYVAHNGSADVFTVGEDGEVVIRGTGTTDMLTITDGDFLVDDGSITITDDQDAATTFSITNDTMTNAGGPMALIDAGNLTDQTLLQLEADSISGGKFLDCDKGGSKFSIGDTGAVTIAGADGADAITLTAGNFKVTDGAINADTDGDYGHNFATSANAAGSATTFFTITNSDGAFDQTLLAINCDSSGAYDAVDLTYEGTANALHITNGNAAGEAITIDVAASTTASLVDINLGAWLGLADNGVIDIRSNAGAVAEAGHAIYIKLQGTSNDAAAISGKGLYIFDDGGTTAGSYLVHLQSEQNDAMYIAKGGVLFADNETLWMGDGKEWALTNDGSAVDLTLGGDYTIGDGGSSNYTSFTNATGAITFAGTARPSQFMYWDPNDFVAVSGPVLGLIATSSTNGWLMDSGSSELIVTSGRTPSNWASGTAFSVKIYYCANDANTKDIKFDSHILFLTDDTDNVSTGTFVVDTVTDTMAGVAYEQNVATIAIASGDVVADEQFILKIERDAADAADTGDTFDIYITGVAIEYTADSI